MTDSSLQIDAAAEQGFHAKLLQIDSELHLSDITALKFLFKDVLHKSKLAKMSSGHDVFAALETGRLMSARDPLVLVEAFRTIGRNDLIDLLDEDEQEVEEVITGKISPYRHMMFDIGQDLTREEVRKMSFLAEKLSKAKREKVSTGFELLSLMEESKLLSPTFTDKLQEYLTSLGRHDLVKSLQHLTTSKQEPKLKDVDMDVLEEGKGSSKGLPVKKCGTISERGDADQTQVETPMNTDTHTRTVNALSQPLLLELSMDLAKQLSDSNEITFFHHLGYSREDVERCGKTLGGQPKHDKLYNMLDSAPALHCITLQDAHIKLVNAFRFSKLDELFKNYVLKFKDHLPAEYSQSALTQQHLESNENRSINLGEASHFVPPEQSCGPTQNNTARPTANSRPRVVAHYKMDANPRGICVILNNSLFTYDGSEGAEKMKDRIGSDIDAAKLEATFRKLNFIVRRFNNLPALTMTRTLEGIRNELVSSEHDCFVCCVLSHGKNGDKVYGSDGRVADLGDMISPFKSTQCPPLAGKPKLFFMQACLGQNRQEGAAVESDIHMETDSPPGEIVTVPNEADVLIGYATAPGFVSYRSKSKGSWYISVLTEMLDKHAAECDVLEILTMVNREIGSRHEDRNGRLYKQTPAPKFTLRKRLVFDRLS